MYLIHSYQFYIKLFVFIYFKLMKNKFTVFGGNNKELIRSKLIKRGW